MEKTIKKTIIQILKKLNYPIKKILLTTPKNPAYGDFYSPVALQIAKEIKNDPLTIAKKIVDQIPKIEAVKKIEIVEPGFINFYVNDFWYIKKIIELIKKDFKVEEEKRKTVMIEFGQPNTHKMPHIGHLYSYIYGQSLVKIFQYCGDKVIAVNYQGDVGLHVAKCLWAFKKIFLNKKINLDQSINLEKKVKILQECYQQGSRLYEEDENIKKEIDDLNIKIYEQNKEIFDLWSMTRKWSLNFYKNFEKKIGVKYERYYFESKTSIIGKKIVLENVGKVFEKSGQTIIFNGKKFGLHTRVFINKYGNPTYEAKDIGLAFLKNKEYNFDFSIVATASEQNEYWKVVIKTIELIFPNLKNKIKHLGFGMVNLTSGKMSSRKGEIVDPFTLIEVVRDEIKKNFSVKNEKILEKIVFAAIKYSFLMSDYKKDIIFDLKKSISKEGNCGPYLLYTYVRTKSLFKKGKIKDISLDKVNFISFQENLLTQEEIELFKKFYFFSQIIKKAKEEFSPSIIANYLYQLASLYNLFYQKYPILNSQEPIKSFRFLITKVTGQIIERGLDLLGIEKVDQM